MAASKLFICSSALVARCEHCGVPQNLHDNITRRNECKNDATTSRKHCKKYRSCFFYCGSFDHPDLQSLKRLHIVLFDLPIENFKNWEAFNIPLERSWKYLSSGVLHVQKKI
jgi:hypothetical protein